jgi:hypothetical protein
MRFGRPRRPGRALAALVIVAAISALGRGIWVNGVFSSVQPGFSGTCHVVAKLPGVQDMEAAGAACFFRWPARAGPVLRTGFMRCRCPAVVRSSWQVGRKIFNPRGIGLYRTPDTGTLLLYAVNRRASGRFSIDSFEVKDAGANPALVAQGTIGGGQLINPQDVAVAGPNIFYVANGTASTNPVIHGCRPTASFPAAMFCISTAPCSARSPMGFMAPAA